MGQKDKKWLNRGINLALRALVYTRLVLVLSTMAIPSFAYAGIFSFVTNMFSEHAEAESSSASVITSQNIALLQANLNPNSNVAKGGGDIIVVSESALLPEVGPSGSMADIDDGHSDQISIYVVREGDTLSQIAKMYGVSTNTILWANDVTAKTIKVGDQLVILPISGVQYTVKKGDTLKSVASKYKADAKEIIQYNDLLADSPLAVGSTLIIPDGEIVVAKTAQPTSKLHGTGGPNYAGYYSKPIDGYVKTQGLHGYNGVDLAAPVGTPIMAAADGEVIVSKNYGWNGGYGEYAVISHANKTQTLYAHMSNNITYAGMKVVKGQIIGYVGSTGKSTGAHLHFEVRGAKNPF